MRHRSISSSILFSIAVAASILSGCSASPDDGASLADEALRAPIYKIVVSSPTQGASVTGTITVIGTGRGFKNVEVQSKDGIVLARTTPGTGGAFSVQVDTSKLGAGATSVFVIGWDAPAGGAYNRTDSLTLALSLGSAPPPPPPPPPSSSTTPSGVPLPSGFTLKASERFGTAGNVTNYAQLHAKYYEGQFYNRDADTGLVWAADNHPEWYVNINDEQQTYVHFEQGVAFASDHITIQGRGHSNGSITSAELVSKATFRSFCVEAKYQTPATDKSWPAFWFFGATDQNDSSELDFEQPITSTNGLLGVHDVSMYNHPDKFNVPNLISIADPKFTTDWMNWHSDTFDASSAPHSYTMCYDDAAKVVSRHIDGKKIYSSTFKWNESLGGTGKGADACAIFNLAVGGVWPGNVSQPSKYSGDFQIYAVDYYAR